LAETDNIKLVPNPNTGRFFILTEKSSEEATVSVINMPGQTVWTGKMESGVNKMEIDITGKATGVFSVLYNTHSTSRKIRITKQ
jgi:hypothetical protein